MKKFNFQEELMKLMAKQHSLMLSEAVKRGLKAKKERNLSTLPVKKSKV